MTKLSEINSPMYREIIQTLHAVYCTLMGLPIQEAVDSQKLAIALQEDCGMANRTARLRVLDMIVRGHTIPVDNGLDSTKSLTPKQLWALYTLVKSMNSSRMKSAYLIAEDQWLNRGEITKRAVLTPQEKQLVTQFNALKGTRRDLVAKKILSGHPF